MKFAIGLEAVAIQKQIQELGGEAVAPAEEQPEAGGNAPLAKHVCVDMLK